VQKRNSVNLSLALLCVLLLAVSTVNAQRKVLRVGLTSADELGFFAEVLKPEFESLHSDVTLEFENIGWGHEPFIVRYASGVAVDVFEAGSDSYGQRLDMQSPLDGFIERDGWETNLRDFPPGLMQSLRYDGKIYGLPYSYATRSFTYRKDLFSYAGLDVNAPPTTWDELVTFGKKLTRFDTEGSMLQQGFLMDTHYIRFSPFLFQAGGSWMSADLTRYTVADDPGIEAVTFLRSLFHEHRICDPLREAPTFSKGGVAMSYEGPGSFRSGMTAYDSADVGVALPLKHRVQTQWSSMNVWSITNTSPYQQESWDWIKFALDVKNLVSIAREFDQIPGRISAARFAPWSDDPRWQVTFAAIGMSTPISIQSPYMSEIRKNKDWVIGALEGIFYEGEYPLILTDIQRQANAWLQQQLDK